MTTPTGVIGGPLAEMAAMVAGSAAFQAWTGAADATEALERVHFFAAPGDAVRPFCIVDAGDMHEIENVGGSVAAMAAQSEQFVMFEDSVSRETADGEALVQLVNHAGAVIEEVFAQGGGGSVYAPVLHMSRAHGPCVSFGAEDNGRGARRTQIGYTIITGVG